MNTQGMPHWDSLAGLRYLNSHHCNVVKRHRLLVLASLLTAASGAPSQPLRRSPKIRAATSSCVAKRGLLGCYERHK